VTSRKGRGDGVSQAEGVKEGGARGRKGMASLFSPKNLIWGRCSNGGPPLFKDLDGKTVWTGASVRSWVRKHANRRFLLVEDMTKLLEEVKKSRC